MADPSNTMMDLLLVTIDLGSDIVMMKCGKCFIAESVENVARDKISG